MEASELLHTEITVYKLKRPWQPRSIYKKFFFIFSSLSSLLASEINSAFCSRKKLPEFDPASAFSDAAASERASVTNDLLTSSSRQRNRLTWSRTAAFGSESSRGTEAGNLRWIEKLISSKEESSLVELAFAGKSEQNGF